MKQNHIANKIKTPEKSFFKNSLFFIKTGGAGFVGII